MPSPIPKHSIGKIVIPWLSIVTLPFFSYGVDVYYSVKGNYFVWASVGLFTSMINLEFEKFPFDKVSTEVELYFEEKMTKVNIASATITLLEKHWPGNVKFVDDSSIWRLGQPATKVETMNLTNSNAIVKLKFNFERRQEYYIVTVFVPLEILMILQLATFVMPTKALDRGTYSITVNLAFTVSQQVINSQLPKTSQTIYLFYYISVYLAVGAMVTLSTLIMATLWETAGWVGKKRFIFNVKITLGRIVDMGILLVILGIVFAVNIWYFVSVTK